MTWEVGDPSTHSTLAKVAAVAAGVDPFLTDGALGMASSPLRLEEHTTKSWPGGFSSRKSPVV